jgi:hypothetical protein
MQHVVVLVHHDKDDRVLCVPRPDTAEKELLLFVAPLGDRERQLAWRMCLVRVHAALDQRSLIADAVRGVEHTHRPVHTTRHERPVSQEQRERAARTELAADVCDRGAGGGIAFERERVRRDRSLVRPSEHEARNVQTRAASSEQRSLMVRG